MDKKKIRKYLDVIRKAVSLIEEEIGEATPSELQDFVEPLAIVKEVAREVVKKQTAAEIQREEYLKARKKHVGDLMAIDCWPPAAPEYLVGKPVTERDQMNRAGLVIDMFLTKPIQDLSVLDFGCGEGWVANELVNRGGKHVVGYDIVRSPSWDSLKATFTSSLPNDKFDAVFLIDVLDHSQNPQQIMSEVEGLLKPGGIAYVRCHPWTSRHATHVFKQGLNKSYIHLFLTEEEQIELGYRPMFTRIEKNPFETYKKWFGKFKIQRERRSSEPLHEFFKVPAFVSLLYTEQQIPKERQADFLIDMETQFVDYQLTL